jgi:spore coat protein JC
MWIYEKKLEYPVKIRHRSPKLAKIIIEQYGGPDGELGAALRYLSQRYTMVTPQAKATLNDVGTEELAHLEMIGAIVTQLTEGASPKEMAAAGLSADYVGHGLGVYPQSAGGVPFSAQAMQSKGDPITDLYENMAAEQKARSTYEYLLDLIDDPDVADPICFLREREIVHFQRFGEALRCVEDYYDSKRMFVFPPKMAASEALEADGGLV